MACAKLSGSTRRKRQPGSAHSKAALQNGIAEITSRLRAQLQPAPPRYESSLLTSKPIRVERCPNCSKKTLLTYHRPRARGNSGFTRMDLPGRRLSIHWLASLYRGPQGDVLWMRGNPSCSCTASSAVTTGHYGGDTSAGLRKFACTSAATTLAAKRGTASGAPHGSEVSGQDWTA